MSQTQIHRQLPLLCLTHARLFETLLLKQFMTFYITHDMDCSSCSQWLFYWKALSIKLHDPQQRYMTILSQRMLSSLYKHCCYLASPECWRISCICCSSWMAENAAPVSVCLYRASLSNFPPSTLHSQHKPTACLFPMITAFSRQFFSLFFPLCVTCTWTHVYACLHLCRGLN